MSKELNQLLKHLEITLHDLHETIREHNKDYFSDDGQEYPVPTLSAERQKDVVAKIRGDLKNLITEEPVPIVKDPPSYKKDNLKPGEVNPKDIGIDGYEYEEDMREDYK
jgi:hypothetical protein